MDLLWISWAFYPAVHFGGGVTQAWEETRALSRSGTRVTVLTTGLDEEPGARRTVDRSMDGVSVRYFPPTIRGKYAFSLRMALECLSAPRRYDLVHLNLPWQLVNPFAAIGARRAGIPYVVSLRGTVLPDAMAIHGLRKAAYAALVEGQVMRRARALIAASEVERRAAASRWPGVRAVVLPPVVDAARFRDAPEGHRLRERYGIAADAPLILFVGRHDHVKGLDLLFAAFAAVAADHPAAALLIVGPTSPSSVGARVVALRAEAVRAGLGERVHIAGLLSETDKAIAYKCADIVVMPSRREGFGQVAAEAMAAGRPVLVTETAGVAVDVERAGAGMVVAPTAAAIAHALDELLRDAARRHEMGCRGAEYAARRYTPESVAAMYQQLYTEVAT